MKNKKIFAVIPLLGLMFLSGCRFSSNTNTSVSVKDGVDGKDGKDGVDGTNGATFLTGDGAPTKSIGNDGDYYLDNATYDLYLKTSGLWSKVGNIKGADGTNGKDGTDGHTPVITIGENGNWYVDGVDTGKKSTTESKECIVTYDTDGGSLPDGYLTAIHVKIGECVADLPTPTKKDCIFEGWYLNEGENAGKFTATTPVSTDIVLKAKWKSIYSQVFTVQWLNYDGSVLSTSQVNYGSFPSYSGETPVKASDEEYDYTFSSWSPALAPVYANTSYIAQYKQSKKKISITFDLGGKATFTTTGFTNNVYTAEYGSVLSAKNFKISYNSNAGDNFISSWFSDQALTKPVSFPMIIKSDMTIYPKWEDQKNMFSYLYDSENEGYILKSFKNTTSSMIQQVTIPSTYNDGTNGEHSVIAMRDTFRAVTNINTVILPDTMKTIAEGAFSNSSITSVTLPNALEKIPANCFMNSSLKEIQLPSTVNELGECAFSKTQLEEISIPEGVTEIPQYCFSDISYKLKTVHLPSTIKEIGENAFSSTYSLSSINLPDSLEKIGANAFIYCRGLTSLELPTNLKSIREYAFCQCTGLSILTINANLETIGSYAFWDCTSLESVILPSTIKSISYFVFDSCSILNIFVESETIPSTWYSDFAGTGPIVYLLSESNPGIKEGNYWHYVNGLPEKW